MQYVPIPETGNPRNRKLYGYCYLDIRYAAVCPNLDIAAWLEKKDDVFYKK